MRQKKKNNCGLLPYERHEVYGLSTNDVQVCGWEIDKFNIKNQWKLSTGKDIRVAVIDTGCDLYHDDIKNNLLEGINIIDPHKDPIDGNGHGTHVSSTIAAENNGLGIVGVAPDAKILPVKALDDSGNGNIHDIINGIIWSVNNKADIITMSLGSPHSSNKLEEAIKYAESRGVVVFCAAGNSGPNVDIMYPAKCDYTISIGAIDKNLERTNFTCSGETLDFLAPGHEILGCVPGNKYAIMSGTSMSNPFAAGCAALLASYARKSGIKINNSEDYVKYMRKNVLHLSNSRYSRHKKYEGYGILNLQLNNLE